MKETKSKGIASPYSTSGWGVDYERLVQSYFVALMIVDGRLPYSPDSRITEVNLQARIGGYQTDDMVILLENLNNREKQKIIGQIKLSVHITRKDATFHDVMRAAWLDFKNPNVFTKEKDVIALFTNSLSSADKSVLRILDKARHTKDSNEFIWHMEAAGFRPHGGDTKMEAIREQLKKANGGRDIQEGDLYDFFRHFYILEMNLESELSPLIYFLPLSSPDNQTPLHHIWANIVQTVSKWNKNAGSIVFKKLPIELQNLRETAKSKKKILPKGAFSPKSKDTYLALMLLVGSWNDNNESDTEAIAEFLGVDYDTWRDEAREISSRPNASLSVKNGIWKIKSRLDLWKQLAPRILEKDVEDFKLLATSVFKEPDPALTLPLNERFLASFYGKTKKHSDVFRTGIAEGLAILGNYPNECEKCNIGTLEVISALSIKEILPKTDWVIWSSLNDVLPILAEVAPDEFLAILESMQSNNPSLFDKIFAQEGDVDFGRNYLTGLLWGLENLAWEEKYLVRVCVILAKLAARDPGGQLSNRPINSLIHILLPWYPYTRASVDKRQAAVKTVLNEVPNVGWKLILSLLPNQVQTAFPTSKPKWRNPIPADWECKITHKELWTQGIFHAELAVNAAGYDIERLSNLIDRFSGLPKPAFEKIVNVLDSEKFLQISENERTQFWSTLMKLINKNERFSHAQWALPEEFINILKKVADKISPKNPSHLYKHLFLARDFHLREKNLSFEEQNQAIWQKREFAIKEVFDASGIDGIIQFSESIEEPKCAGWALGKIESNSIESKLLPHMLLDESSKNHEYLTSAFVWQKHKDGGWEWSDNVGKKQWTPEQIGAFLASLPFDKETWTRASEWLGENEKEYWTRVYPSEIPKEDYILPVDKFIECGKPFMAINYTEVLALLKRQVSAQVCIKALLAPFSFSEVDANHIDHYKISQLIQRIQSDASVASDELCQIEWLYMDMLKAYSGYGKASGLENKLANDPDFFCDAIRSVYRPKKETDLEKKQTEEEKVTARKSYELLSAWSKPPGLQKDKTFDSAYFNKWLASVKGSCTETGHLDAALEHIGQVLIHTPADPGGLWINQSVALVLNAEGAEEMREGFSRGIYNSRGCHWVDPTGKPEKELAEKYRKQADEVENAGYHRLAVTLRGLEKSYGRQAQRNIDEAEERKEEN